MHACVLKIEPPLIVAQSPFAPYALRPTLSYLSQESHSVICHYVKTFGFFLEIGIKLNKISCICILLWCKCVISIPLNIKKFGHFLFSVEFLCHCPPVQSNCSGTHHTKTFLRLNLKSKPFSYEVEYLFTIDIQI